MKPGGENLKSNCVSDNSDFFFNYVPMNNDYDIPVFIHTSLVHFRVNAHQFQPSG